MPYYSRGLATARDSWCYNYSLEQLRHQIQDTISFYNEQRANYQSLLKEDKDIDIKDVISYDPTRISWNRSLLNYCSHNRAISFEEKAILICYYRPFMKQNCYYSSEMNDMVYQLPKLFPTSSHRNLVICVSGIGASKDFSALMTDCIPDLQLQFNGQCFPLYWYDDSTADIADLFSAPQSEMDRYVRRDGVTDWILSTARKQYGSRVTKEDIFYYVYGILHAPDYRTTFAADLKKSLPRLPLVESPDDFWAFSRAGRSLAELHLGYEHVEPYAGCRTIYSPLTNRGDEISYLIDDKMRFGKFDSKTSDKRVIHYNAGITIENIPLEAYDYIVNGKSAIEWVMERYAVKTDPASQIENNPNDWCREHDDPKYIYNLLLRIITVSLETMKIVRSLPKLKLEE